MRWVPCASPYGLALCSIRRGEIAIGGGWVARAERLLEAQPEDIVERGYLLIHEFFQHLGRGDFARAEETAARAVQIGRRFSDQDLIAQALNCQGRVMIYSGRISEGLALLDEAMVAISAGEVAPIFAGNIYCSMIEACQELSDFSRAASWTIALTKWCDAQPGLVPYTGQCSVHRGQIMRLRGAYDEALAEFALAQRRYRLEGTTAPAALALTEQGDVLRLRGKLDEAEACYQQAAELGREPQPGLALSWLARGRTAAAVSAMRRLLAEAQGPVRRSGCCQPASRSWWLLGFWTKLAGMPRSSPRLPHCSATPQSRQWLRTREPTSGWPAARLRMRSYRPANRPDCGTNRLAVRGGSG